MNEKKLRPAKVLTEERKRREGEDRERAYTESMRTTVGFIEAEHEKGGKSVIVLSLPDSVVEELHNVGYRVKYNKAAGTGDMDSHSIEWD